MVVQLDGALDINGEPSEQVSLFAYLNARLQTGMPNPSDEAIVNKGAAGAEAYAKVDEIPYDFVRKRLTGVVSQELSAPFLITKGALDNVLAACTRAQVGNEEKALDNEMHTRIQHKYEARSGQGFRVLGLAVKSANGREHPFSKTEETGMTFMGFLLFFDPPKAGVQATI
jgi:P-type Mg2+ transporter